MKFADFLPALSLASIAFAQTFSTYTDDNGIEFWQSTFSTSVTDNDAQWGLALPAADAGLDAEYIGHIVAPIPAEGGTWFGLTHSSGMTSNLILIAWNDGEEVKTSFRYATGYTAPAIYSGNATLTPISSNVNDTFFELTYRCQNCWEWEHEGVAGENIPATTSAAAQIVGWAQATAAPSDPSDEDSAISQHAKAGVFGAVVASARNPSYTQWTSLATATEAPAATGTADATVTAAPTGTASLGNGTATSTEAATSAAPSVTCPSDSTVTGETYDYIIVGAGAGGIPIADKLSAEGNSVLLIERGPPSSGRWGGTMKPEWLEGTNLTRFDVPGLDNQIWADSDGIACTDYSVMAGCVLGGGTAVNAGLWWRAHPSDFDYNFPEGWKSSDMEAAVARTFERIPFTDHPSTDGIIYKPEGYEVVAGALAAAGWENVTAGLSPAKKNMTFSRPNHMFNYGERDGPMATYLVSASERENFKLITNTTVNRVVRDGSRITGVEVDAFLNGGECGTINVTPNSGKVILSAGAFGTPKILFRSGIGPQDQLEVVKESEDGDNMIDEADWINLPVGYNLDDHANTDIVITHPNVSFYDFYAAYDNPIESDTQAYLESRTGILAQSAPNLIAAFWQEITGADGIVRSLQYTARVEGSHDIESNKSISISQYLGRGAIGRGRTTITSGLNMIVDTVPYLQDEEDLAAVATGIDMLKEHLSTDPSIEIVFPPPGQSTADFLAEYPLTTGSRSANHWMGTAKMGTDSGLEADGTSVVDLDTKVYGTDNLFVVDASIFPGMVTTNPSALIVAVAEHASDKIMNAEIGTNTNTDNNNNNNNNSTVTSTAVSSGTAVPSSTGTGSPVIPANSEDPPYPTGSSSATAIGTGTGIVSESACTPTTVTLTGTRLANASTTAAVPTVSSEAAATTRVASSEPVASSEAAATTPVVSSAPPASTEVPVPTTSSAAAPVSSEAGPSPTPEGTTGEEETVPRYGMCGGVTYEGPTQCEAGSVCKKQNAYYHQCVAE